MSVIYGLLTSSLTGGQLARSEDRVAARNEVAKGINPPLEIARNEISLSCPRPRILGCHIPSRDDRVFGCNFPVVGTVRALVDALRKRRPP